MSHSQHGRPTSAQAAAYNLRDNLRGYYHWKKHYGQIVATARYFEHGPPASDLWILIMNMKDSNISMICGMAPVKL